MIAKKTTFIALFCSILFSMHSSFGMRRFAQTAAQSYGRATPRVVTPAKTMGEVITPQTSGKLPISSETKRALSSNVPVNPLRGYRAPEINAPQQLFSGAQSAIQPPTEPLSVPLTGPLSLEEVIEKLKTSQPVDTESFKRAIKNAQDKGIKTIFIQQSVVDSLQDLFSPLLPNNTSTTHIIEQEGKKIFEAHRTPAGLICLVTNVADLRPVAIGKQITKESLIKNFNIPAGANESVGFSTEDMTSWLKKIFTPAIKQTTLLEAAARETQVAEEIIKESQGREEKAKQRQLKKQKATEQKAAAIKQAQKEELDRLVAEKQAAEQKAAKELRIKTEKLEAEKTAKEKQIALKAEKAAKKLEAQKRETALIQAVEKAKQLSGNKVPQPQQQQAAQPKSADITANKTTPAADEPEFHLEAAEAEIDTLLKDFEKNTQRTIERIESELNELKKQKKQTLISEKKQKELGNEIAQLQKKLEQQNIQSAQQKSNLEKMEAETLQAKQKAQEASNRADSLQAATDQIILEAQLTRDAKIIQAKKSEAETVKNLDAEAVIEKERILTQFETAKKELLKTESFKKSTLKQQEKMTEKLNQEMLKQINAENKSINTQKTQLHKKLEQQLTKDLKALDAQKLKAQKDLNKKSAIEIQQIKDQTTARLAILEKEHQELIAAEQKELEQQRLGQLEQIKKQDAEQIAANKAALESAERQRLLDLNEQRTQEAEQNAADIAAKLEQEEVNTIAEQLRIAELQNATRRQAQLEQQAEQQRLAELEQIKRQDAEQLTANKAALQAVEQQRLADLEQVKKDTAWQQSIELINKNKTKSSQPETNNSLPKKTPDTQLTTHISPEEIDQERLNTLQQLRENDAKQMSEQINQAEDLRLAELITAQHNDAAQKATEIKALEDAEQERLAALQSLREEENEQETRNLDARLQQEEADRITEQLRGEELQNTTQQQAELDQQAEEQRLAELEQSNIQEAQQIASENAVLQATEQQRLADLEQTKKDIAWQQSIESINKSKAKTSDSAPNEPLPKKTPDIQSTKHISPEEIDQERLNTLQQLRENDAKQINEQIKQAEDLRLAELITAQGDNAAQKDAEAKAFEDAEQERLAALRLLKEQENEQEARRLAVFLEQEEANKLEKAAPLAEQQKLAELERINKNEAQQIQNLERLMALQPQQKDSLPTEYEPAAPKKYSDIKTKELISPADTPEQPLQQWPMVNPLIAITPQPPMATFPTLQSEPFLPETLDEFPHNEYFEYQPPQSFMDFLPGEELPPLAPQQFITPPQAMTVEQATEQSHKKTEKIAADLAKAEQLEQQHEAKNTAQEKQTIAETVERFTEKMPIIMPLPDGYSPTQRVVTQRPSSNRSTQSSLSTPSYYQSRSPQLNASMPMTYFPQTYSQAPTYSGSSYSFDQPTMTTYSPEMALYQTPLQDLLLTDYTYVPLELEENTPETVAENRANTPSSYDIPPIIALEEPELTETLLEEKKELTTAVSPTRAEQQTTKPLPSIQEKIEAQPQKAKPIETPEEPKKISFFWKILQAIIKFFRNLLGYTSPMASG